MSLCARCGLAMPWTSDEPLCSYHGTEYGERWSDGNRVMCDFFHRGVVPERVKEEEEFAFEDTSF